MEYTDWWRSQRLGAAEYHGNVDCFAFDYPLSKTEFIPKSDALTWKNGRIHGESTVWLLNWQEQSRGEMTFSTHFFSSSKPPQIQHGSSPNILSEQEQLRGRSVHQLRLIWCGVLSLFILHTAWRFPVGNL